MNRSKEEWKAFVRNPPIPFSKMSLQEWRMMAWHTLKGKDPAPLFPVDKISHPATVSLMKLKHILLKPIAWTLLFIGDLLIAAEESFRLKIPFKGHFACYRNISQLRWDSAWN